MICSQKVPDADRYPLSQAHKDAFLKQHNNCRRDVNARIGEEKLGDLVSPLF